MRKSMVKCPKCKGEFQSDKVEFLNIEEDIQGKDVMTFTCPKCETEEKSNVFLKW
jgi:ssDNA-binding Zn-finger/Zn-ribbon topoisomerase 1